MALKQLAVSETNHDMLIQGYEYAVMYNMQMEGVLFCKARDKNDKLTIIFYQRPGTQDLSIEYAIERAYSLYDVDCDFVVNTGKLKT